MTDTMKVEMESAATEETVNDTSNKEKQDESGAHKPRSRICMLHCNFIFLKEKSSTAGIIQLFVVLLFLLLRACILSLLRRLEILSNVCFAVFQKQVI